MNNKEILKNVLVTVGLLTTSIIALVYFNTKLKDNSTATTGVAIAPSVTIHQYVPTSFNTGTTRSGHSDMLGNSASAVPSSPAAVKLANYPNDLLIHSSAAPEATNVSVSANTSSTATKSTIAQQRQQMQMGALTAVNSRRLTSETVTKTSQMGEPFQESTEVPGTISRKDLPEDPPDPFPDEEAPLGSGLLVLGVCALGYTLKQKLSKAN